MTDGGRPEDACESCHSPTRPGESIDNPQMLSGDKNNAQRNMALPWHGWLMVGLLVLASLTSKALGAAWALFTLMGLWQLRQSHPQNKREPFPAFLRIWVLAALAGFTAKALATLYWHDPWSERHGEIRMLLGALAAYGAYGFWRARIAQRQLLIVRISHALSLTALLGLAWVVWKGRGGVPSHPIPWAGIMAMFSCWLLAVGLDDAFSPAQRRLWLTGSGLAVLAVLASQSRGAFVVVLWWLAILGWQAWRGLKPSSHRQGRLRRLAWATAAAASLLTALSFTPVLERPRLSLQAAVSEAQHALRSPAEGSNSSVGARLYMWQRSLQAIAQEPWLGHGHDGRKQLIQQWAQEAQSDEVHRLGHVHNEYLHQLIDHGLLGLISQASILLGLLYVVLQQRITGSGTASLALGGMWIVYAVGSLSNVNFAHNYYTAGLSLMTGLTMGLLSKPPCAQTPPEPS